MPPHKPPLLPPSEPHPAAAAVSVGWEGSSCLPACMICAQQWPEPFLAASTPRGHSARHNLPSSPQTVLIIQFGCSAPVCRLEFHCAFRRLRQGTKRLAKRFQWEIALGRCAAGICADSVAEAGCRRRSCSTRVHDVADTEQCAGWFADRCFTLCRKARQICSDKFGVPKFPQADTTERQLWSNQCRNCIRCRHAELDRADQNPCFLPFRNFTRGYETCQLDRCAQQAPGSDPTNISIGRMRLDPA